MRRHAFPVAVILILAGALFFPAMRYHEVFTFRDHTDYFQPLRFYTALHLRAGRLPLWNPYNGSGEAWLANPQSGVFYPPTWLFTAMPFAVAYMAYLLVHVALLGVNAYVLFVRRATRGAALAGAAALMFCGPVVSLWDVNNNLATFAWIPLAIWCGLERHPRAGGFVLALAFLGGEPFFAGLAAMLYLCAALCGGKRPRISMAQIAQSALIAIGTSAIQLFPFVELLHASDRRAGLDREVIFRQSMKISDWMLLAIPPHGIDLSMSQQFIPIVYVGVVTMVLAIIGLTVIRDAWPWVLLLCAAVIVAAGNHLPAGEWMVHMPVTMFRYPARLVPFGALAVIALMVIGLDRLPKRRLWVDISVVLLLLVDLVPRTTPLRIADALDLQRIPYPAQVGADSKLVRLGTVSSDRGAWLGGYLNLYSRRFDATTAAPVAPHDYSTMIRDDVARPDIGHLDSINVGWVITDRALPSSCYQLAARVRGVGAWHSLHVQPAARVMQADGTAVPVRSIAFDSAHVRVSVDTPRGGLVVLTQRNAPGWRVFVDNREAPPEIFDHYFRAVRVSPGKHEILWTFRPLSLLAGACVTLMTFVALALRSSSVKR